MTAASHLSILGTAISHFGELWDKSLVNLAQEVAIAAVRDAALEPTDIDAVFVANKAAGNFDHQLHINALVSEFFPHFPPAVHIEAACASGGAALLAGEYAIRSGQYNTVLVIGAEKMTDASAEETTSILSSAADVHRQYGSTFPALYGLVADVFLRRNTLTAESLAAVAVKNHRHALTNEHAQFRKELTLEDVARSTSIAPPLRVLDCSPISDGAAALVLSSRRHPEKARIIGTGHGQDTMLLSDRAEVDEFHATRRAAAQAFATAGVTPAEISVAEVHDCFTIAECVALADLGFFSAHDAGMAALRGDSTHGGKIIINPSGGLKACGHPVGATGVKQVAYLAQLLSQGEHRRALAHNVGGVGATSIVHILERGGR